MRPNGRGLIPGKQLQEKPNRTRLTGQGWTYRFRIKSLDFLFILIDSGLCFICLVTRDHWKHFVLILFQMHSVNNSVNKTTISGKMKSQKYDGWE